MSDPYEPPESEIKPQDAGPQKKVGQMWLCWLMPSLFPFLAMSLALSGSVEIHLNIHILAIIFSLLIGMAWWGRIRKAAGDSYLGVSIFLYFFGQVVMLGAVYIGSCFIALTHNF